MQAPQNPPRWHHFVPQFHLRRFQDASRRLAALDRDNGAMRLLRPKQAAAETDFYTVDTKDGGKSYEVEKLLSLMESHAAAAIRAVLEGEFPLSEKTKEAIAMFIGLQTTRGPDFRDTMNKTIDHMTKFMVATDAMYPAAIERRLRLAGLGVTEENIAEFKKMAEEPDTYSLEQSQTDAVMTGLKVSVNLGVGLVGHAWNLVTVRGGGLFTSDHPITLYAKPRSSFYGIGLFTADEVRFALSPSKMLILTHDGPAREMLVGPDSRDELNRHTGAHAYRLIFSNPSHAHRLRELGERLKSMPRPGIQVGPKLPLTASTDEPFAS